MNNENKKNIGIIRLFIYICREISADMICFIFSVNKLRFTQF